MSIIVIKSKVKALGAEAFEPKYKKEAVFKGSEFMGFVRNVEVRSMIAVGETVQSTLLKAIERKLRNKIIA